MGLRLMAFRVRCFWIGTVLTLLLLAGARAAWRTLTEGAPGTPGAAQQPLLIVGTLDEADQALRTLTGVSGWQVVGIVCPMRRTPAAPCKACALGGASRRARSRPAPCCLPAPRRAAAARGDALVGRWPEPVDAAYRR